MSKAKKYIDTNVYDEGKKRIRHIINTFDKIYVSFSGGKDSLAVLRLVEEVYAEMGITKKINVVFRDEELIPDDVIDFVTKEYNSGRHNFLYYAIPLKSNKFILGKTVDYVQWDNDREWLRPKPKFAITLPEGDKRVFDQYTLDEFIVEGIKGKIAFITGVRADESLIRLQSCLVKKNENYINSTKVANVKICKPIYDWSQDDVFLYFYKAKIEYCEIYDIQALNGDSLRVSTPLHSEASKKFHKLKTLYPTFYQQLIDLFPEMLIQDKYWKEYDRTSIIYAYAHSWDGIMRYINDTLEGSMQRLAKRRVLESKTIRDNKLKKGEGTHNLGGYPILYVFKAIVAGQFKNAIQPKIKISRPFCEYEGLDYDKDYKD